MKSEDVIIEAPMSFTGSAKRLYRMADDSVPSVIVMAIAIVLAWLGIAVWYVIFFPWLVPFRLYRRGQRKQVRDALRHRELGQG